jgi:hypothetical protein
VGYTHPTEIGTIPSAITIPPHLAERGPVADSTSCASRSFPRTNHGTDPGPKAESSGRAEKAVARYTPRTLMYKCPKCA